MRVYGGSERTEGLSQEETTSREWFTSLMTITHTACRYLKRWVWTCSFVWSSAVGQRCTNVYKVYSWRSVFYKCAMIEKFKINVLLSCLRWGAPSEYQCGRWGWLEGWNMRGLSLKEERWVLFMFEFVNCGTGGTGPRTIMLTRLCFASFQ